jgi:hypothetical protein
LSGSLFQKSCFKGLIVSLPVTSNNKVYSLQERFVTTGAAARVTWLTVTFPLLFEAAAVVAAAVVALGAGVVTA